MKILVVEDEHRIATSLKKGLEQEGYLVDLAFNGDDGLDQANSIDYDCIILDLMLPGTDGIAICKELRKADIHTPIIMLTARGQLSDKLRGFEAGADDYLPKPFAFDELLARVKSQTRKNNKHNDSVIEVEDLVINTKLREVRRGAENISLSAREYSLLEYLSLHQRHTLTKEQIIGYVWEYDSDILPNTVEVYIKKLRQKIDLPFPDKAPLIHTVRGFGYKLGK